PQAEPSFLVKPEYGLPIWTVLAFVIMLLILRKYALPRIRAALDRRSQAIIESIDAAERTRSEADELLSDYRRRLEEAGRQAQDIVARAERAADRRREEAEQEAERHREEMREHTQREIEHQMRRAVDEIRGEAARMTVIATERIARSALDEDDHRRLIEEALEEADFSVFAGADGRRNGEGS
ncbi:MAG: F0F1 ATP synthase subunit B, partial [Actinomycetota bacterium]|nr:F0F1 ATP synthase subunit B [Actinomycetota bacterium]